ncbi:hypothetical protein F8E02_01775 [Methanoculleus sp. Wushi-C6]|uniref:DUF4760 domain-containing protein n=1 Tax=Methanoculleus caldifontis TaxID=2651577 RepID=A0ABU3WY94_9EURY|nr:hypothetical protein [Methanoculleus sp. Wushi-C6]MDV2480753.1 hypothetical protein [Methanoculleus sp. Wushi-C6]
MKKRVWLIVFGTGLIVLSIALYALHYLIYRDFYHIGIYTLGDIAFLPLEVLLVTLVVHQVLESHDRRQRIEKLNVIVGAFFSALGTYLLAYISDNDPNLDEIRPQLMVAETWTEETFSRVEERLKRHPCRIGAEGIDFSALKDLLGSREEFLLRLLENPVLIEHEWFTELLQAIFHFNEELKSRPGFSDLPDADIAHLARDLERIYGLLIREWLEYMRYLQKNYPYLFSLAMRRNPFDEKASAIIR